MKTCNKCGISKPIECFYKHSIEKDGHTSVCKDCIKKQVMDYSFKHLEKVNEEKKLWRKNNPCKMGIYRKQWHINNPKKRYELTKKWRKNNPEKSLAHGKINRAVRKGTIKKDVCILCGKKAVAHHYDYSKPLNVIWLCQKHHREEHSKLNLSAGKDSFSVRYQGDYATLGNL